MIVIPAVDLLGGECVRLKRGDFSDKKVYSTDPVAVAKEFERQGAGMLHIVDLDGAKTGIPTNTEVIRAIKKSVRIPIEVGGGIRSVAVAEEYLAFADRIVLGTKALEDISFIGTLIKEFGSDRIVVALETKGGEIATEGWQKTLEGDFRDAAQKLKRAGVSEILFTDVGRDGMLGEPNYGMVQDLTGLGFNVIASGGVSDISAIAKLSAIGASGAIVGTALYEKKLNLQEALTAARPASNLTKRIIPCLDVKGGVVVKGVSFENLQDVGDPVSLGKKYSDEGADELVFLDISASREGRETIFDVVEKVAKEVFIPFTVGGGITSIEQIRKLLQLGADKVSLNTSAVKNPELISEAARAFGQQCIVVAIDAKKKGDSYGVFLKGGTEETPLDAVEWAKEAEKRGAGEILLTSMDKDGTKAGYDIELLRRVSLAVRIPVIASGGAGSLEDLRAACAEGKADAVLVASLFHYGEHSIKEAKEYLSKAGIPMRI
jgi:cyclase